MIRFTRVLAILVLLLPAAMPAFAGYCVPPAPSAQPAKSDQPSPVCKTDTDCPICKKSPCYLAAGNYINNFVDLQIPTGGMNPLIVTRHYDSGGPTDGPLGAGWSSSLTAHLYYATYLLSSPNTYTYEADVVMPSGVFYRFTMSGSSFSAPLGTYETLTRNSDGTYLLTLGHTRSVYRFNADGALASLTDDYGNAITYTYDGSGRLQRMADSAGSGRYIDAVWGADGRLASLTDNAGRVLKYFYDANGTLTSYSDPIASADPSLRTTYYSYVASRFGPVLSRIEDRWHRTISNLVWYADGRMQSYTEGDYNDNNPSASSGEKYTYTYGGVSATKTDSLGSKTYQWAFSGVANDATQTFDPVTGLVISETMQAGNTVSYTYSARGNVATATPGVSGGPIWTYTYDSNYPDSISAITSSQPSQWAGWKYLYYNGVNGGPPGALMQVNRVGTDGVTITTVATFSYDAKGHATSHIDSLGNVRLYSYNALGDLTSVTSSGNTTSYDHDALGRVTKMTTPSGHATTYNYDDDDRVKSVTLPSPATIPTLDFTTRMSYDNFDATTGLVSTVSTDPNGHTTTAGYDALGHLVRAADAKGNVTQYSYQYNLPHSITDANSNVTSYSYNADRYLVKTTFFDGTFETYAVNAFGGVTSVTDRRGQPTNYLYDGYGRPTSNAMGSYAYAGQNLTFGDGVSYTYDSQWHVATETQAGGDVITYTYGSGSDLLASYRVDRPAGQPGASVTATFGYDSSGRVVSLQWSPAGSFNFSYNADGQYSVIQFPNGQTRTFTYDGPGRLATLANGDLTFSYGYDYDWPSQSYASLGNRTSVNVSGLAGQYPNGTTKYIYDAAQQLTGVTHANGTTSSYTYDAIGNRTLAVIGGGTNPYIYYQNAASKNTPRLRNALGPDLTYDANGNLTTYGYTWDAANRLTAISSIPIHYQYDFQGRRNLYTPGTGSPVRYVSWGMNTIAERSTDTTRSNDYAFGPGIDEPLARRASDGSIQYYLVDGLGSVVALTSATGDITSTATYDEFGVTSSVDLFGYTGRELASSAFNLWNYRARYYRADWGRFISEDPMPPPWGDLNIYRYVTNNPVRFSDPTGMYCCGQSFLECLGECLAEGDPLAGVKKLPLTLTTPIPKAVPKFFGLSTKGFAGASKWTTPANVLNQATGGGKAALKWGGKVAWAAQIGYGTFLFGLEAFCSAECAQDKCAFLP